MRGVINVVFSRLMCDVRKTEFTHAVNLTGDILPLQNNLLLLLLLLPLVLLLLLRLLGFRLL